jgi:hypothetical protein
MVSIFNPSSGLVPVATSQITSYASGNYGPIAKLIAPPSVASLTWVNQGSSTATNTNGGLLMVSAQFSLLVKTAPATPYTFIMGAIVNGVSTVFQNTGIVIRDSGTGKLQTWGLSYSNITIASSSLPCWGYQIQDWSAPGTYASSPIAQSLTNIAPMIYFSLKDDGTNFTFAVSYDGLNFIIVLVASRTAYLANPNQIGIVSAPQAAGNLSMLVLHWSGV